MKFTNIIMALAFMPPCAASASGVSLSRLTVEGRVAPVGIDVAVPRFGWQIVSSGRNVRQESYRIIVSSSEDNEMDFEDPSSFDGTGPTIHYNP